MVDQDFILRFYDTSRAALSASSKYINDAIRGKVDLSGALVKADKTVVTVIDNESQRIALEHIQRGLPEYGVRAEEGAGLFGNLSSPMRIMLDPLDGTSGFMIGMPTPTVIMGAYDRKDKNVLAVSTMEPSTGRFWFSAKGKGAHRNEFDYSSGRWEQKGLGTKLAVSQAELNGSHVLIDVTHQFARTLPNKNSRHILGKQGRRTLTDDLETLGAKETTQYSNGAHYALVAGGRPGLVGCITTAIGGPFDIAGIRHVIEAGGVAECYVIEDALGRPRGLKAVGQDIESADLVIAANNSANLMDIRSALVHAVALRV